MSGVLVLHPWWGLNDDIRAVAARLAGAGYSVRSPDLYDGRVATAIPEAERLMASVDRSAALQKVEAAADELGREGSRFAILGWSMGGGYAWELIRQRPDEVSALVAYYAIGEIDTSRAMPPVLHHIGELDEDVPFLREIDQALKAAGTAVTTHVYPGARHWFDEPSRPEHDPGASELAWGRTMAFLRQHRG